MSSPPPGMLSPEVALGPRIDELRHAAAAAHRAVVEFGRTTGAHDRELVVHVARRELPARVTQLVAHAEREVAMLDGSPGVGDPTIDAVRDAVRRSCPAGVSVRVHRDPIPSVVTVDRTVALLQAEDWLLVRDAALVSCLVTLFDAVWRSTPSRQPDELDVMLLRLMLEGRTDAHLAARLGVSVRTVQRRIADIMATLGTTTRFQTGAAACLRGWLDVS